MARFGFVSIVHGLALFLSIIELGLTGYEVSVYHGHFGGYGNDSPGQINFMLFNSIWSILVLLYIGVAPLYMTGIFHRLAALVLESLTMLFWFAGSVALAVALGIPHGCSSNNLCRTIQATIAFGFFLWALFAFLVILDAIESLRSRRGVTKNTNNGVHA